MEKVSIRNHTPNNELKGSRQTVKRRTRSHRPRLSKHDPHNLELKFTLDFGNCEYEQNVDLYFFLPPNIPEQSLDKNELYSDFTTRFRIGFPRFFDETEVKVEDALEEFEAHFDRFQGKNVEFKSARRLGGLLCDLIKAKVVGHQFEIIELFSLKCSNKERKSRLIDLSKSIEIVSKWIQRLHRRIDLLPENNSKVIQDLDEYSHIVYVDYLSKIKNYLDKEYSKVKDKDLNIINQNHLTLGSQIESLLGIEAQRIENKVWKLRSEDRESLEKHAVRISQLKKYFQSEYFIEQYRTNKVKRLSEPVAIVGAACAGITAALVQKTTDFTSLVQSGVNGIFIISFGIVLYVLRDRLKDRFKMAFNSKLRERFADHEYNLMDQQREIGNLREWFTIKPRKQLPKVIQRLRRKGFQSDAESYIREDVIVFSNRLKINSKVLETSKSDLALQRIMRINVNRFLKYLDDTDKSITRLMSDGSLSYLSLPRTYHFFMGISLSTKRSNQGFQSRMRLYRIVVKKDGVERVEKVSVGSLKRKAIYS